MEKKCFYEGCVKRASSECRCQELGIYCCNLHLGKHTKQLAKHDITYLWVKLTEEENQELLVKAIQGLNHLKSLKKSIRNSALEFIRQINTASHKALKMVKDTESVIKHFYAALTLKKSIYQEQYQWIKDSKFPNKPKEFNPCYHFSELFQVDLVTFDYEDWKECSEIIFSSNEINGGLWSIDLKTFEKVPLNYAPKIEPFYPVCKIDRDNYFFYGGKNKFNKEGFIVNTKEKKFETLKCSNDIQYCTGSALKDNKVYVFGGRDGPPKIGKYEVNDLNVCQVLDLKTKLWSPITALPLASSHITAALCNGTIILSGYQLPCLYSYDRSSFFPVLSLPPYGFKVVFDGWVLTSKSLFEASKNNVAEWTLIKLNTQLRAKHLLAITVFKRGIYFYFIEDSNSLMRLDTVKKTIETVIS